MPPNYLEEPGRYPRKLPYDPDGTAPLGYREAGQPIRGMWIAGLSIFAGTYGGPAIVGGALYASTNDSAGWLLAPVIGPIALGVDEYNGSPEERSVIVLLSLLSITQATGVALFVAGLAAEQKVYLRNDVAEMDLAPRVAIGPGTASVLFPF